MWPLRQIKDWFFPVEYLDKKATLAEVREYIPAGKLDALLAYQQKHIPYVADSDPLGLDNYNGAALTQLAGFGDCESIGAWFTEIIIWWKGWECRHIYFMFARGPEVEAHDVAFFTRPDGITGWIDGAIRVGSIAGMKAFYKSIGWEIGDLWFANDMGKKIVL